MARKKYSEIEQGLMKDISRNLKSILVRKGISQKELCELTGLATSTISDYVNAKTLISPGNLQIISDALKVEKSEIDNSIGKNDFIKHEVNAVQLPIIGRISCGSGMLAYEDIEGYEDTPKNWIAGGEYFYLYAKGDSMIGARVYDGDLLLIRKQPEVEDGEIAVVMIDDEAVLKRVYRHGDSLLLQSENTKYTPIICKGENVKIIGKLKKIVINI